MTKQENNSEIIIKKYANRRLYNTQTSCYITLEDLYDMLKRGEDFIVRDAKTDEDLTRQVLTQIIFEQEAKGYNLLPIPFLKSIIGLYGNNQIGSMLPNYLNISMENFLSNKDKFSGISQDAWQEFTPTKIFENVTKQNMEIFENTMKMFTTARGDKKDD